LIPCPQGILQGRFVPAPQADPRRTLTAPLGHTDCGKLPVRPVRKRQEMAQGILSARTEYPFAAANGEGDGEGDGGPR
jgi:hypothetical protein